MNLVFHLDEVKMSEIRTDVSVNRLYTLILIDREKNATINIVQYNSEMSTSHINLQKIGNVPDKDVSIKAK